MPDGGDNNSSSSSVDETGPTMHEAGTVFAYLLLAMEFSIDLLCTLASIVVFYLLFRTSVLHRNLKFILSCQCCVLLLNALIKVLFTIPYRLITGDIFWLERMYRPTQILIFAILYARIMISCVLVLERTLATVYARRYERDQWRLFNYTWFIIMVIYTVGNVISQQQRHEANKISSFNLANTFIITGLTCAEIMILALLWWYNRMKFRQYARQCVEHRPGMVRERRSYDLTERYQYLENMRTSLQLGPTMVLYLLNTVNSSFLSAYILYSVVDGDYDYDDEFVVTVSILFGSVCNLLMQVTTICLHPILKRNFLLLAKRVLHLNRVEPSLPGSICHQRNSSGEVGQGQENCAISNSSSSSTNSNSEENMEEHFRILAKYWR